MTAEIEPAHLDIVTAAVGRQEAFRARCHAIHRSGCAIGQGHLGFVLALRSDLSEDVACALLAVAPKGLDTLDAALAWAAGSSTHPETEFAQ